jgi:hypothetical protein
MDSDAIIKIQDRFGGYWGEHPDYPHPDWQQEAANGATRHSYWDWVYSQVHNADSPHCPDCFRVNWMRTRTETEIVIHELQDGEGWQLLFARSGDSEDVKYRCDSCGHEPEGELLDQLDDI